MIISFTWSILFTNEYHQGLPAAQKNIKIIQHQYASQTPPILSFSGYLTDDELGALDAADPRKALSEFGAS